MTNIRLMNRIFRDVCTQLPVIGAAGAKQLSGDGPAVLLAAKQMLRTWPQTVVAGDGETILLHNLQRGTLDARAEHLVTSDHWRTVDWKKVRTMHLVPRTLEDCSARLFDPRECTNIYVGRYAELTHLVVVKTKKHPPSPDGISGYLITQFPYEQGGRQSHFQVKWA